MGSIFRSEEMALAQLFIQPEAAYSIISELGEAGCVQFRDLNDEVSSFQRRFVNEVLRCNEMERQLRFIEAEIRKDSINIPDVTEVPKAPNPREIIDLEAHLETVEGEMKELNDGAVGLKSNSLEIKEFKYVLEKFRLFFSDQNEVNVFDSAQVALTSEENQNVTGRLEFVAGVINRERVYGFERMLWRVSRGNIFFKLFDIEAPLEDPINGKEVYKAVFFAFFQGEQLKTKVKKICTGFHASLYPCPTTAEEAKNMLADISTRLEDLTMVLNQTQDHRHRVLISVAKDLQNWTVMVNKIKAIYHTLNCFSMDVVKKFMIGECWVPCTDIPTVQKALADGSSTCGSSIPSFLNVISNTDEPPTFYRTNKFTRGFQNLIDAYGVASYREVNPGLYTIITFPFLFAVMFGDCGHALIMTAFGLWMILAEKKLIAKKKNEIFRIFFGGRYIILLMGLFSFYTGFLYNDMFSKSMNVFRSQWFVNSSRFYPEDDDEHELLPKANYHGTPYFMGIDPVWQLASNKIIFLNSFKMKLSIIFGVVHMIFGVCVGTANFIHFRKYSSLFLEFLPQLLFLVFLFFYLVVMIFMKWIWYSGELDGWIDEIVIEHGTSCSPSVLIYFINMFLMGSSSPNDGCDEYMYEGQKIIQIVLLLGALLCIPVMLLGKPLYVMFTKNKANKANPVTIRQNGGTNQEAEGKADHQEHEEEEEPISEVFIHQAIHTIEYTLSTVSHTASYLRLWALSLAHAQLSEVLWTKVLHYSLFLGTIIDCVLIFVAFGLWAVFTVTILVLMEGLSAFLHTLRLHWVEFMSKFYVGTGYLFQPFSFKLILEEDSEE
ncbi:V-type proton ATPase 116 kDa subunit a isoform X2 [Anoplophora glabripennis]|nr:V-type proton ATPase 116 kDa subunit a isoform X2 [Anoplophora glabripennis]